MPGPWITLEEMKTAVANILKLEGGPGALEPYWVDQIGESIQTAYSDLKAVLVGRGYTLNQLDSWDDRRVFNRQQALFWLYTESSLGLGYDDKEISKLNRVEFLKKEETIMINEEAVPPGQDTGAGFGAGGGVISEDGYRVNSQTTW